jgi:hypothetical protein
MIVVFQFNVDALFISMLSILKGRRLRRPASCSKFQYMATTFEKFGIADSPKMSENTNKSSMVPTGYANLRLSVTSPEISEHLKWYQCTICFNHCFFFC